MTTIRQIIALRNIHPVPHEPMYRAYVAAGGNVGFYVPAGPTEQGPTDPNIPTRNTVTVDTRARTIDLDVSWSRVFERMPGSKLDKHGQMTPSNSTSYVMPSGTVAFADEQIGLVKLMRHLLRADPRVDDSFKMLGSERYKGRTIGDVANDPRDIDVAMTGRGPGRAFVPVIAYHGTSLLRWEAIQHQGLTPNKQGMVYTDLVHGYSSHNLYLALDPSEAEKYATRQAHWDKSQAVVLKVRVVDTTRMLPDEDAINGGRGSDGKLFSGWVTTHRPYNLTVAHRSRGQVGTVREVQETHVHTAFEGWHMGAYVKDAEYKAFYREVMALSAVRSGWLHKSLSEGVFAYRGPIRPRDISVFRVYPLARYPSEKDLEFENYQETRRKVQDKMTDHVPVKKGRK